MSLLWQEMLEQLKIKSHLMLPYHPQGDGPLAPMEPDYSAGAAGLYTVKATNGGVAV